MVRAVAFAFTTHTTMSDQHSSEIHDGSAARPASELNASSATQPAQNSADPQQPKTAVSDQSSSETHDRSVAQPMVCRSYWKDLIWPNDFLVWLEKTCVQ